MRRHGASNAGGGAPARAAPRGRSCGAGCPIVSSAKIGAHAAPDLREADDRRDIAGFLARLAFFCRDALAALGRGPGRGSGHDWRDGPPHLFR